MITSHRNLPSWIFNLDQRNRENIKAGTKCPSHMERILTQYFMSEVLPNSKQFRNFKFVMQYEWMVNRRNQYEGKGDLVLSDGQELLVVEIKFIGKRFVEERRQKLLEQSLKYGTILRDQIKKNKFQDINISRFFQRAANTLRTSIFTETQHDLYEVELPKVTNNNTQIIVISEEEEQELEDQGQTVVNNANQQQDEEDDESETEASSSQDSKSTSDLMTFNQYYFINWVKKNRGNNNNNKRERVIDDDQERLRREEEEEEELEKISKRIQVTCVNRESYVSQFNEQDFRYKQQSQSTLESYSNEYNTQRLNEIEEEEEEINPYYQSKNQSKFREKQQQRVQQQQIFYQQESQQQQPLFQFQFQFSNQAQSELNNNINKQTLEQQQQSQDNSRVLVEESSQPIKVETINILAEQKKKQMGEDYLKFYNYQIENDIIIIE